MKPRDYFLRGSVASISAGGETKVTWDNNNETYYYVNSNEGLELVKLGVDPAANVEYTYVKNRDNTDWQRNGFLTTNDARMNELPYTSMRDWSMITARISPDMTLKRPITLKMSTGDKLQVSLTSDGTAVTAASPVGAVVRRWVSENAADTKYLAGYGNTFGGIESNGQAYNILKKITSTSVNSWTDVIDFDILKDELYSFISLGIGTADAHADIAKIMIDDEYEYNTYPIDVLPLMTGLVNTSYDPTGTAAVTQYGMVESEYDFSQPLVVSKTRNKNITVQVKDDGTAVSGALYARLMGVRYKLVG